LKPSPRLTVAGLNVQVIGDLHREPVEVTEPGAQQLMHTLGFGLVVR
jgi:hypothetical protein